MPDKTFSEWDRASDSAGELSSNTQWLDQHEGLCPLREDPARGTSGAGLMCSGRRNAMENLGSKRAAAPQLLPRSRLTRKTRQLPRPARGLQLCFQQLATLPPVQPWSSHYPPHRAPLQGRRRTWPPTSRRREARPRAAVARRVRGRRVARQVREHRRRRLRQTQLLLALCRPGAGLTPRHMEASSCWRRAGRPLDRPWLLQPTPQGQRRRQRTGWTL